MFLRKHKKKQIFCWYNILTDGVFVTQLSSRANAAISVRRIVCYDKLLFHERDIARVHIGIYMGYTVAQLVEALR
jgi:hypothetical protein